MPAEAQHIARHRTDAQSYLQAAQTMKQNDPSYGGWMVAATEFRKAATAFRLAGDLAQERAANDQAQTLETALKIADQYAGPAQSRTKPGAAQPAADGVATMATSSPANAAATPLCAEILRKADSCFGRAVNIQSLDGGEMETSGQAGPFLNCFNIYCRGTIAAGCAVPIYCKQTTTQQDQVICGTGKHLFFPAAEAQPICQDNANGSTKPQPEPASTITGNE